MPRIRDGKKVGYTYYSSEGMHTGITNNPERRRAEHNRNTGGRGFLKIKTSSMNPAQASRWERGQRNTRGYSPIRRKY